MHRIFGLLIIAMIGFALFAGCAAAEDDRGLLTVSCSTKSADISIVSNNKVIATKSPTNGSCDFYVSETSPIDTIIAEESTHCTNVVHISASPKAGERKTASISVGSTIYPSGGDYGYVCVYANVLGAKVEAKTKYGINTFTGYTNRYGYAQIPVNGEDYRIKSITISSPGWVTEVLDVDVAPKGGHRVTYQVYLTSTEQAAAAAAESVTPTSTPTPEETKILLGYATQPVETQTTVPASSPVPVAAVLLGLSLAAFCSRKD